MRPVHAAAQAAREARRGIVEIPMLWIEARHRETGVIEALGLWGGSDDETITVTDMFNGVAQPRLFHGAGALLSIGAVRHEAGLTIRAVEVALSPLAAATRQAFRAYDARGAQAQVWTRSYDAATRKPLGVEARVKGYVNGAPIERPAPGGEAGMSVEIVSPARMLTVTSALRKSDETQRARAPGDRFRRYKATIAQVDVPWGMESVRVGK